MKRRRRLTALLLSAALICSCAVTAGAAAPEEEWTFVPGYVDDDFVAPVSHREHPQVYIPGNVGGTTLPSSFDLRNVGGVNYMTAVRNQGSYGTCWAHATIASVESNLLMQGYTGYEDLSELQVVFFTYNRSAAVAAEGGGTAGDVVEHTITSPTGSNVMQYGGNEINAAGAMAARLGVIQESELSYSSSTNISKVIAGTLEDKYARSMNDIALDNYLMVNIENKDAIKRLLMTSGAGTISYFYSSSYESADETSYYYNGGTGTNHAVTLCGWNDNYAVSNFKSSNRPSNPGAWLCKNSWGTSFGDSGYFWISYEDTSLSEASFFDVKPVEEDYDYLYQYDGGIGRGSYPVAYGANIFTAERNEELTAVRFDLMDADATVTVKVYTGVTAGDPDSGTLQSASTTVKSCDFAGTYTVALEEPVPLSQGESFSVVMRIELDSGGTPSLPIDYPMTGDRTSVGATEAGQSYYGDINNGSVYWWDMGAKESKEDTSFNLRLKALTNVPVTPGDVNGDGEITIADAVMVTGYLLRTRTLNSEQLKAANANGVGSVDEADVIWITKTLVGLIP